MQIKNILRYVWMPGSDIFTRRRIALEHYWSDNRTDVLDAGFGNGWFSYRAYRRGSRVLGVSNQQFLVEKAQEFYNGFLEIPDSRLKFEMMDLYDVSRVDRRFDQIICYETLEHIEDDRAVCRSFYDLLKPRGELHLCCPNAEHPRWCNEKLDLEESGGHVRCGYTLQSYRALLEPIGYSIEAHVPVGGAWLVYAQEKIQYKLRSALGEPGAYAISLASYPLIRFDSKEPETPFSIYIKAVKQ